MLSSSFAILLPPPGNFLPPVCTSLHAQPRLWLIIIHSHTYSTVKKYFRSSWSPTPNFLWHHANRWETNSITKLFLQPASKITGPNCFLYFFTLGEAGRHCTQRQVRKVKQQSERHTSDRVLMFHSWAKTGNHTCGTHTPLSSCKQQQYSEQCHWLLGKWMEAVLFLASCAPVRWM